VIENRSGTIREEEGCLSLPGVFGVVERSKTITVKAMDADGKPVSLEATGLKARIVQHELDHLDGVLFIDRLPPVTRDRIKKKIQKGLGPDGVRWRRVPQQESAVTAVPRRACWPVHATLLAQRGAGVHREGVTGARSRHRRLVRCWPHRKSLGRMK
jgi:hypothetical protein